MYDQEKTIVLQNAKDQKRPGGSRKVMALTVSTLCLTLVVGYQNCAGFHVRDMGGSVLSSHSYDTLPVLDVTLSDGDGEEVTNNPCENSVSGVSKGIESDRVFVDYLPQVVSGYDILEVNLFCSNSIENSTEVYENCDTFKLEQNSTVHHYRNEIDSGYYDYVKYRYNDLSDGVHELYAYAAAPADNSMLTQITRLTFQVCD